MLHFRFQCLEDSLKAAALVIRMCSPEGFVNRQEYRLYPNKPYAKTGFQQLCNRGFARTFWAYQYDNLRHKNLTTPFRRQPPDRDPMLSLWRKRSADHV